MPATALSAKLTLLAHGTEVHEDTSSSSTNILSVLTHQSAIVSIIICAVILLAFYGLLGLLKVNPLSRLLYVIPASLALGVLYYPHQAIVSTLLLSGGFIFTFFLAFAMLKGK